MFIVKVGNYMNFCSKCGTKLDESGICVNCNSKLAQNLCNDYNGNKIEKNKSKKLKISKVLASVSFVLALLPILLIIGILLKAKAEPGAFNGLFLIIVYACSFPGIVISFVCGIISFVIGKNRLAFYSVIIDASPFILYFALYFLVKLV